MQEVVVLHGKAMDFADRAEESRRQGDREAYLRLTSEAFKLEAEAAWLVSNNTSLEPTRSVLFKSAATLAIECGNHRAAEKLVGAALAGDPPPELADELRDLLEDIYFNRHLEIRGITLTPGEVQMSLEGNAVGFGIARSDTFVQRVKDFETLLYRTAERRSGREFREAGRRKKNLAEDLELYLSVPRAASFAVTMRLGRPQLQLPGMNFTTETMKELLDGLTMVNEGDYEGLEKAIPDESYRLNFIGLAERLAPDGRDIKVVGFSTGDDQDGRIIALATPKLEMRKRARNRRLQVPIDSEAQEETSVEIRGVLLEADATNQKQGVIEVVDATNTKYRILVPRGMMSDIVKPMFEEMVVVVGIQHSGKIQLQSIDLVELDKTDG